MNKIKLIISALMCTLAVGFTANASFTDADLIPNAQEVEILTAMKIIGGNPDGSFNPNGDVTRAEMATMIFILKNGGDTDASAWVGYETELVDIEGNWYEGYVKYCEAENIISGKGNGIFDPEGKVTGVEALKMAIVAMGYECKNVGISGSTWAQTTLALAESIELTTGYLSADFYANATRADSAQILYNALYANTVSWNEPSYDNNFQGEYLTTETKLVETTMTLNIKETVYVQSAKNDEITFTICDLNGTQTTETYTWLTNENYSQYIGKVVEITYVDVKEPVVLSVKFVADVTVDDNDDEVETVSGYAYITSPATKVYDGEGYYHANMAWNGEEFFEMKYNESTSSAFDSNFSIPENSVVYYKTASDGFSIGKVYTPTFMSVIAYSKSIGIITLSDDENVTSTDYEISENVEIISIDTEGNPIANTVINLSDNDYVSNNLVYAKDLYVVIEDEIIVAMLYITGMTVN